ncbi:hypothetical protein [Paludisphaera rhizosphaerae]|uniref:hypothetical protein n=1 Tax=Paludisphaera rhizosphaerae TaxID=2711216 RepID=UPI0013EC4579|nr:hypothetical protein [Paludisphaera rhizosphaerae]
MSPHRRLARLPILAAVVLSVAGLPSADASPITGATHTITYSTYESSLGATSVSAPSISFQGVQDQTIETASPFGYAAFPNQLPEGSTVDFPIGKLIIGAASAGASGYHAAEYAITIQIDAVDGVALASPITTVIQGALIANAADPDSLQFHNAFGAFPSMEAPYNPPGEVAGVFTYDGVSNYLLGSSDGSTGGMLDLSSPQEIEMTAQLVSGLATNTPEPAAWLVFALVAMGAWQASRRS